MISTLIPWRLWLALVALGFIIFAVFSFLPFSAPLRLGRELLGTFAVALGAAVSFLAWPQLGRTLVIYGYAARIQVIVIMFLAMKSGWRTHYDDLQIGYPEPMDFWGKYLRLALVPQLLFWLMYTLVIGAVLGVLTTAIAERIASANKTGPAMM